MPTSNYIISELVFHRQKRDAKTKEFVKNSGIDLSVPFNSKTLTVRLLIRVLEKFEYKYEIIQNEKGRVELLINKTKDIGIWLILNDYKDDLSEIGMFQIGRGSNDKLLVNFFKTLSKSYGNFLFVCGTGNMSLIIENKDTDLILKEIYEN